MRGARRHLSVQHGRGRAERVSERLKFRISERDLIAGSAAELHRVQSDHRNGSHAVPLHFVGPVVALRKFLLGARQHRRYERRPRFGIWSRRGQHPMQDVSEKSVPSTADRVAVDVVVGCALGLPPVATATRETTPGTVRARFDRNRLGVICWSVIRIPGRHRGLGTRSLRCRARDHSAMGLGQHHLLRRSVQDATDLLGQRLDCERLGDVGVDAGIDTATNVVGFVPARHHHDRNTNGVFGAP